MNFSRFLDIQSWWEVPSIAYFCSLFRTAFNLLDFDIEELEEALLTDGTEESASSLLTELIVRLLNGCLGNNDISAFNYQMYLRRLFRRKCQETGRYNPFNTDIDFQFLPLRTKVEILYALCDFRLDAEDVFDLFKNLEAESLRVEPLGWDDNDSAYWYFYGTRLYREDILKKPKGKSKKKKSRESRKRGWFYGDDWLDDEDTERVWQVVCFTEEDWTHLTEKFSKATSKVEKELFRSLSQNFLPEIPRLFQEKERLQRKRLLELAPRRTSSRVLQKIKQKEEERKRGAHEHSRRQPTREPDTARENRARRRDLLRSKSESSDSSSPAQESSESEKEEEMPQKVAKRAKPPEKRSKNSGATAKGEPPPEPPVRTGRKTNNSLACATGQILIPDNDEPVNSTRKKLKTSQIFSQTDEDVQIDMYKVLEQLTAHDDAWPFMDPVEEEYAPNYYAVIRRPMDLRKMEERLDSGYYTDFNMFKADFKLIVNNCRLYNGQDNEYTTMVDNLQAAFDRLTEKYIHRVSSSDEEIAVEYQLPTPSRKHKLKRTESPVRHKRKKRKSHTEDPEEPKSSSSEVIEEPEREEEDQEQQKADEEEEEQKPEPSEEKHSKESHRNKEGKGKKKRKGHHRHGKHSKNHKKNKSEHGSKSRHSKKQKHAKNKDREGKRSKKKKSKHHEPEPVVEPLQRSESQESLESSSRSRSASPLPSIHSPTPSPTELDRQDAGAADRDDDQPSDQLSDPQFCKDKYDKIKERRRHAAKDAWDSLFDHKQKSADKPKQNLRIPEKERNQKLRETIEKLKAKNEKLKENSLFNSLFTSGQSSTERNSDSNTKDSRDSDKDDEDEPDFSDNDDDVRDEPPAKKGRKKNTVRNESASVALEQAVKDISKWLDEAPKGSIASSPSDSPAQTISTEDADNSRQDDESSSQGEKPVQPKKETTRKRPSSREPKLVKRREIQRTIDRLQPGKSKGNLLTNLANKNSEKLEESTPININKTREVKTEESSPKLSLGSVLPAVEFTLGSDHNFSNEDEKVEERKVTATITSSEKPTDELKISNKSEEKQPTPTKKDAEVETDPTMPPKPNQEKATPNLSAWFKAFGAPKNTASAAATKKKNVEVEPEDKTTDVGVSGENKSGGGKQASKSESPKGAETAAGEGSESPLPGITATPRQRRTSTGSSVSERSSFSQDLDSPRHLMSHNSPLLRSPASPRPDEFQKISYPIINGTVRAGFYQDTTSVKSSPEKSCSPREMPQSPYSPYSQHVYISSNATGSATPNYFVDHNKSPLPTYGQNAPSYYDSSKSPLVNKPIRIHDDYTPLPPESFQQNHYNTPAYSAVSPRYQQAPAKSYSQAQVVPPVDPVVEDPVQTVTPAINSDPKTTHFPVKKRTYSEPEELTKKAPEPKNISPGQSKNQFQKLPQPAHQLPMMSTVSVDDIALALSEKSEMAKLNALRETVGMEYTVNRNVVYDTNEVIQENKKDTATSEQNRTASAIKPDNVDMVNMGYMNPDHDRRSSSETHQDIDFSKPTAAMNLGMNNHQPQKSFTKASIGASNMIPAHSHERQLPEMSIGQNIPLAHHNPYDTSTFSLNDIELANKKLYSCNTTPESAAIDYGNWKVTNQARKADIMPSDYSTTYSSNNDEKHKVEVNVTNSAAVAYNRNLQQQQYNVYNNVPRPSLQRTQEMQQVLAIELRIPNPRNSSKNDHMNVPPAQKDSEPVTKNTDTLSKTQKTEKHMQNHPLVSSIPYKTPYSAHSSIPLDTLRSLPSIPQMLERYANDERYLSSFATPSTSIYHDKSYQMFNKSLPSEAIPISTSVSAYTQPSPSTINDSGMYKTSPNIATTQTETKPKMKRKRTAENKSSPISGAQTYHTTSCNSDILNQSKTNMVPPSAFNFGTTTNMALGGGLYGDNGAFSMEDFRNSTSHLMAANYMAAAVVHQQQQQQRAGGGGGAEGAGGAEKLKPAHSGAFPFAVGHAHGQARAPYAFVGAEASAPPLYQQYLQRHQEELLRQTGAQIMSLYSPAYPAALGVRPPPYDAINRHAWL